MIFILKYRILQMHLYKRPCKPLASIMLPSGLRRSSCSKLIDDDPASYLIFQTLYIYKEEMLMTIVNHGFKLCPKLSYLTQYLKGYGHNRYGLWFLSTFIGHFVFRALFFILHKLKFDFIQTNKRALSLHLKQTI